MATKTATYEDLCNILQNNFGIVTLSALGLVNIWLHYNKYLIK